MKVLITGGCGFVGTNLAWYLINRECEVRILDNLSTPFPAWVANQSDKKLPKVEMIKGDVRDRQAVETAVESMDAVVHLAALTSVIESVENPSQSWDINVGGMFNLLEVCREKRVERFVFASSNAVTGEQVPPIDEKKIPQPLSPYGASKLTGEALCSAYWQSFGIKTFSLRFANLYGPFAEHKTSVIALFMQWIKKGKPLVIYGNGEQTRDFVHVDDVSQAVYLALKSAGPFGETFQIAKGEETSINEMVGILKEIAGSEVKVIYKPDRVGEIMRNFSDISKAQNVLSYKPEIELREGLEGLWNS